MRVHEVHAAVVHTPLVLLPASALIDLRASLGGRRADGELGRTFWWLAIGSAALAGVAGMAASQEVKADDDQGTADMMWIHGVGNTAILLSGLGMAVWRTFRRPSLAQSMVGLGTSALAIFTAYLGGEMVYGRGVGVRAMPGQAPVGVADSPPVLSREAPGRFLRDAGRGLIWLLRRAIDRDDRRRALSPRALGIESPAADPRSSLPAERL
jgi:uncharacterized membrane protein